MFGVAENKGRVFKARKVRRKIPLSQYLTIPELYGSILFRNE